jgi:hypothetical protein
MARDPLPPGATFVRLRYPTPAAKSRFGFAEVPLDPLFHVDAYVAARRGLVDLSDYQAKDRRRRKRPIWRKRRADLSSKHAVDLDWNIHPGPATHWITLAAGCEAGY